MPRAYDRKLLRLLLKSEGVKIDVPKLDALYAKVDEENSTLANLVIKNELVTEEKLLTLVSKEASIPPVNLTKITLDENLMLAVDKEKANKFKIFPVSKIGDILTLAVDDPFDRTHMENLEIVTEHKIRPVLSTEKAIKEAIKEKYFEKETPTEAPQMDLDKIIDEMDDLAGGVDMDDDEQVEENIDKGVIGLTNKIIIDAYQQGVSDIHVEPYFGKQDTVIRFRVDGHCREYRRIPNKLKKSILARLKIMSGLDIAERRKPQDGKIKFKKFGKLDIELRLATIPTVGGNEDAVMRILASSKPIPLEKMGFSDRNISEFKRIIQYPYGLVLVVGPTGSGKTTTLHSGMGFINQPNRKIWTAEDPVEITQYGLRQVQIHHKIGLTFEAAMRAFLRADPDVIMVGEMRDHETAAMGVEASLTGHIVLSTLHTNSAPETIVRLIDMGLDPFNFADALLGVLAQRLTRRLCASCRESHVLTKDEYEEMEKDYDGNMTLYGPEFEEGLQINKAVGCTDCSGTGYRGRMGIHELLVNSDEIREMIQQKAKAETIRDMAMEQGMTTLKQDGILKVFPGDTDLQCIRAVCIK